MQAKLFNKLLKSICYDKSAISEIYSFYYKRIVFFLSPHYGQYIAQEVAQDFFVHLFDIAQKQEYINSPTSWIYTCCENMAKRKAGNQSKIVDIQEKNLTHSKLLSPHELYGELYKDISQLDDISQEIILLFYWYGYSLKEIAQKLDQNYATIRKKHSRALARLNKCHILAK